MSLSVRPLRLALATIGAVAALSGTASAAVVADAPTLDDNGSARTTVVNGAYQLDAGVAISCPATAAGTCRVRTVATVAGAEAGDARIVVASGATLVKPGAAGQVRVTFNGAGASAIRHDGSILVRLNISATDGSSSSATTKHFQGQQLVSIPPKVLTEAASGARVPLAPGQRLVLRLAGGSSSTGYSWSVNPLTSSALRLLVDHDVADPCPAATPGCPSTHVTVYASRRMGVVELGASLTGPADSTPTKRFKLTVLAH
ncbi:MAG: hypothetical protein JWM98_1247 [Thermoleophilia bacterium]|nr:hypothetical protein [Thermoleophilia bacterium]